jgi:hypothetical protein
VVHANDDISRPIFDALEFILIQFGFITDGIFIIPVRFRQ